MKVLKRIGLAILSLIVLLLLAALVIQKDYTVEKKVIVNKPINEVFSYIKYAKNQDYYNKWVMQDPNIKKEYRGTDGTVGFVAAWNGNNKVGKGEQEIKSIRENERVDYAIHFDKPMEENAEAWMTTESVSDHQTKINWGMHGRTPYPFNILNFFIPNILGKDMTTSLNNLKAILEK